MKKIYIFAITISILLIIIYIAIRIYTNYFVVTDYSNFKKNLPIDQRWSHAVENCEKRGGTLFDGGLGFSGPPEAWQCEFPFEDLGESCTSSSQCIGYCKHSINNTFIKDKTSCEKFDSEYEHSYLCPIELFEGDWVCSGFNQGFCDRRVERYNETQILYADPPYVCNEF